MATDLAKFDRQIAAAIHRAPTAAVSGVVQVAYTSLMHIVNISPRDTRRYVRAWQMVSNDLPDVPKMALAVMRESKYAADNEARLDKQVARLQKLLAGQEKVLKYWSDILRKRYTQTHRKGYWQKKTAERLKKAEKRFDTFAELLRRAKNERDIYAESLKQGGVGIVIGGRRGKKDKSGKWKIGANQLTTVRATVYGGSARVVFASDRVFVIGHNKEAHASIVESRLRVVARAAAMANAKKNTIVGGVVARKILEAVPQE